MKKYTIHFDAHFTEEAETEDEALEMAYAELREDPTDGNWMVEGGQGDFPNPDAITDLRKGWFF